MFKRNIIFGRYQLLLINLWVNFAILSTYLHVMFVWKLIFQEFQDTTFLTSIVIIYLLFFLSQVKDSVWKSVKMSHLDYISKKSFPSRKSVFIAVKAVQKQSIFVTFLAFSAVNIAPAFPSRKLRCEGSKFRCFNNYESPFEFIFSLVRNILRTIL